MKSLLSTQLSEESLALYYLRRELSQLRQALGSENARLFVGPAHTLRLDLEDVECDVREFDRAIARADEISLERAVALYRGMLLEGCTEEWAVLERNARERAYVDALEPWNSVIGHDL